MKKHLAILLAVVMLLSGCVAHSDKEAMGSTESTTEPSTQQATENASEATEVTTATEESTESATDSTVSNTEASEAEKDNQTSAKPSTEPTQAESQTKPQETTPPSTKPTQPTTKPTEPPKATEPPVTATLTLGASSKTLTVGDTYQIPYTYTGTRTLTWVSEDDSVATVSSSGKVTAKKKGNILVEVFDGVLSAYCEIIVQSAPTLATSIDVKTSNGPFYNGVDSCYAGDYVWVVFRVDSNATNKGITATSSNTSVVSVSSSSSTGGYNNAYAFNFNFKSAGSATISVKSADGAVTQNYKITVNSGYGCSHGGGTHSPEDWAACATNVADKAGMTKSASLGSWRSFTLNESQLTFSKAVQVGQGFIHDYWVNGVRKVYFEYVGQTESGAYQFKEFWG